MIEPASFKPNGVVGTASAGELTTKTYPNYAMPPDMLPSNKAMVSGRGCAGTKSNVISAKGIFEPYNKMIGGNQKLSTHNMDAPDHPVPGVYSGYLGKRLYNNGPVNRSTNIPRIGGMRKQSKRIMKKKRKKTIKKRRKRNNRMRGGCGCGCKSSCGCKWKLTSKSLSGGKKSRKNKRRSRRVTRGGGGEQPFSNRPISFGYAVDTSRLPTELSGLATPHPIKIYDNCGKYSRK